VGGSCDCSLGVPFRRSEKPSPFHIVNPAYEAVEAAILADDENLDDIVLDNWGCLSEDDKRKLKVLKGGGGGASSFAELEGDPKDNAALAAALAAAGGALPSWDDQEITTLLAVAQGDPITATGLSNTPTGRVDAYNPGGQHWRVGNGVKTKDIYFSGDGGTTARAYNDAVIGDIPYLGTTGSAAGGTEAGQVISLCYTV
jgi:hypothetical protein